MKLIFLSSEMGYFFMALPLYKKIVYAKVSPLFLWIIIWIYCSRSVPSVNCCWLTFAILYTVEQGIMRETEKAGTKLTRHNLCFVEGYLIYMTIVELPCTPWTSYPNVVVRSTFTHWCIVDHSVCGCFAQNSGSWMRLVVYRKIINKGKVWCHFVFYFLLHNG